MAPRLLFAYCPAKVFAHRVRVEWEFIPKEKALEFLQYLDVSSSSGRPFFGKAINATYEPGLCGLKFKQRKVTLLKVLKSRPTPPCKMCCNARVSNNTSSVKMKDFQTSSKWKPESRTWKDN